LLASQSISAEGARCRCGCNSARRITLYLQLPSVQFRHTVMGRCPSCGKNYLFSTPSDRCCWCGKITCKNCLPRRIGGFTVKTGLETRTFDGSAQDAPNYGFIGLCSGECRREFWKAAFNYPLVDIGTDVTLFGQNVRKLWYAAILHALSCAPDSGGAIDKVKYAMQIETQDHKAILLGIGDDGTLDKDLSRIRMDFINNAYLALAKNLERNGRPLDASEIYRKKLKMYVKARQLRNRQTLNRQAYRKSGKP
jgi:hypothetical protein